jgi:hypothetical protein
MTRRRYHRETMGHRTRNRKTAKVTLHVSPKGPKKTTAATLRLTKFQKKVLAVQLKLTSLLKLAAPKLKPRDVSWMSVDIAGLWEVGLNHKRHVRELLKCSYPRDREKIDKLLTEMQVNLLSQGADHLKTLQKSLPRVRSAVYRADDR